MSNGYITLILKHPYNGRRKCEPIIKFFAHKENAHDYLSLEISTEIDEHIKELVHHIGKYQNLFDYDKYRFPVKVKDEYRDKYTWMQLLADHLLGHWHDNYALTYEIFEV